MRQARASQNTERHAAQRADAAARASREIQAPASFTDARPGAAMQRRLMETAGSGPAAVAQQAAMARIDGSPRLALQRKMKIGDREIFHKTLTDGSAFKTRLTEKMDALAEKAKYPLSREEIRGAMLKMVDDGADHDFDTAEQAIKAAIDTASTGAYGNVSLIFGMGGRDLEQTKSAIKTGYRRFDCAESYNNTAVLAQAIKESGVDRSEFKVCYKFDVKSGQKAGDLESALRGVAAGFGGKLDDLVIHNLDVAESEIETAWGVLNKLKGEGVAGQVGVGNVGVQHAGLLGKLKDKGKIDVIENSVTSLLKDPGLKEVIQETGAKIYFYDVVKAAQAAGVDSPEGVKAVIATMVGSYAGSESTAIMTSGDSGRQKQNLRRYGDRAKTAEIDFDDDKEGEAGIEVYNWTKKRGCDTNDTKFQLPGSLHEWLARESLDSGVATRKRIAEAAQQQTKAVNAAFVLEWLASNGGPSGGDLALAVPSRKGMDRRYLGKPLRDVLAAFYGPTSCDWKWSTQLVQLLTCSAQQWDEALQFGADEIMSK